ncbi:MAG: Gfo/Idh/MocA family oxidoreductase [Silvibacterium sp.]|nr:Gfo/Idh/MocA family oxidoreductase [Silvibacterium sp.]MBV8438076.1 Gfo/Idh/MocA family oxidoreductase [Silvibacterium sp.]
MIRYGILGFGHHAAKRLMKGFREAKDSKPVGLWRRDATKAVEDARKYSIPHIFETPEDLCASREIDSVFVVSPDALHLPHVKLAAKHGKAVLCEKPLGMNASEVEEMVAASETAGVRFGVAQNMRYNRSLELMRKWIAEGRIGKPVLAHAEFAYSAAGSPRTWIYDPSLACGGPIGDVGIHCIDGLRFVLGTDVTAVSTLAHGDAASGKVESYAVMGLDLASGAMATVTTTTRAEYRTVVEVTGETGTILCENGLTVDFPVDVVFRRGADVIASETVSNEDAYSLMLDGFSAWVEGKGMYLAPASDALHNQRVLDAAYTSWRDGMRQVIS